MAHQILNFLGFYLIIIGTWRLANATTKQSMSGPWEQSAQEDSYRPYQDLYSFRQVACWIVRTIRSFKTKGEVTGAVILHRQFNWGLFWLLLGVVIQYVAQFL